MDNGYKYSGERLTMKMARELILELFSGKTETKQNMIRRVDEVHVARGGKLSKAVVHPVLDALTNLKPNGMANNPKRGTWTIIDKTADVEIEGSDEGVKWMGSGNSFVYVYYYPTYKLCAELQKKKTWPCKIGHIQNSIDSVPERESMPERNEIALVIQTNKPVELERAIHKYLARNRIPNATGPGWFMTNPNRVEEIYDVLRKLSD